MSGPTKKIGKFGEKLAQEFLQKRGYIPLQKNIVLGRKEIDLIVKHNDLTVFVEVKSRTSTQLGEADTALSSRQLQTLKRAISIYCAQNKIDKNRIRLDLIAIDINIHQKTARIKHYRDII